MATAGETPRSPEVRVEGADAPTGAPLPPEVQARLDGAGSQGSELVALAGTVAEQRDRASKAPDDAVDAAEKAPDASATPDASRDGDAEQGGEKVPPEGGDQPGDGDDAPPDGDGTPPKPEKKGWLAGIKDTASSWLGDGIRDLIDLFENVLKWTGVAEFLRWLTNTPKEETEATKDLSTEIATAIATVKNSTIKDALEERLKTITEDTEKTADKKEPLLEDLQKDTECYTRAEALEAKITADPKLKTEFEPKLKEIKDTDLNVTDGNVADPAATLGKIDTLEQEFDAKAGAVAEAKAEAEKLPKDPRAEAFRILHLVFELDRTREFAEITEDWTVDELNGQYGKSLWNNFGWGEDARLAKRLIDVIHEYIDLYPSKPPHSETDHVQDFIANIFKDATYIAQFKAILTNHGIGWKEPDGSTLGGTTATETADTPPAALEQQYITTVNEQLASYQGKTVDLTNDQVAFDFPSIDQASGTIQKTPCTIRGNTFTIGDNTYTMELPAGAKLQSMKIEGAAPDGSATLVAGAFMISQEKSVPLQDMLGYLEELRKGPPEYTVTIGGDQATFRKTSSSTVDEPTDRPGRRT